MSRLAPSEVRADRFGLVVARGQGCPADRLHLGWVPGRRYRIWSGTDLVLGYSAAGAVIVRGDDGRERQHLTAVHRSDRLLPDSE